MSSSSSSAIISKLSKNSTNNKRQMKHDHEREQQAELKRQREEEDRIRNLTALAAEEGEEEGDDDSSLNDDNRGGGGGNTNNPDHMHLAAIAAAAHDAAADEQRPKRPRLLHPLWEQTVEPHQQYPDSRVVCKHCGVTLRLPYGYKLERLREHYGLNVNFIRDARRGKGCIKNPFQPDEILPFSSNSQSSYLDWKDHVSMPSHNPTFHIGLDAGLQTTASQHEYESDSEEASKQQQQQPTKKLKKRGNVLSWDDYFMSISFLSAMRSKDPNTQVGACIVNEDQRIVGIGYNGFPRGCSDDELPWNREADNELDTKYPYVCHAEVNAILNKNSADLKNCKMYVALFPCNECAKMIIQSGIKEVVYLSDKYAHTPSMIASRRMFLMSKIKLRQHTPAQPQVCINFTSIA